MTEKEQQRLVRHCLAIIRHAEEVTGNVSQTCRYFGITRQTFYRWLRRYEQRSARVTKVVHAQLGFSDGFSRW
jgi:transposase-like protein